MVETSDPPRQRDEAPRPVLARDEPPRPEPARATASSPGPADLPYPSPQPDAVTQPFWDTCARRQLCFQECAGCGHRWLPPSVLCPRCWGGNTRWVPARGEGVVFSFAVYHRAYHPAFRSRLPYVVAVIELSEGPRLVSNVIGIAPAEIRVDMPVRLDFEDEGGVMLPVFRPAGVPASRRAGGGDQP